MGGQEDSAPSWVAWWEPAHPLAMVGDTRTTGDRLGSAAPSKDPSPSWRVTPLEAVGGGVLLPPSTREWGGPLAASRARVLPAPLPTQLLLWRVAHTTSGCTDSYGGRVGGPSWGSWGGLLLDGVQISAFPSSGVACEELAAGPGTLGAPGAPGLLGGLRWLCHGKVARTRAGLVLCP